MPAATSQQSIDCAEARRFAAVLTLREWTLSVDPNPDEFPSSQPSVSSRLHAFGQWPIDVMDWVGIAALEDRLDALEVVPPALGGETRKLVPRRASRARFGVRMCALPHAAMVSARWSSANGSRMFGRAGPAPMTPGPTRAMRINSWTAAASRGIATSINDPPP